MSRTTTLWTSAILTIAFVLIVGTILLRSGLSQSAPARPQPAATVITDASQIGLSEQPLTTGYQDDHHDHGDHHEDHSNDD